MPEAIGSFTRRYEARLASRFVPAPRPSPADAAAQHEATLDWLLARAAVVNGWPDGKPPPWPKRAAPTRSIASTPKAA